MKIFWKASEAGDALPCSIIAIGKFDALHRGHQRVIGAAVRRARALKTPCIVVTFDPSPEEYLRLFSYRPVLSLAERLAQIKTLGADAVLLLAFDRRMARMAPETFAGEILGRQLKPIAVFVGKDFCFGKNRAGRVGALRSFGEELGFTVHAVPLLKSGGEKISATRIRALMKDGRLADAERLLGRCLRA